MRYLASLIPLLLIAPAQAQQAFSGDGGASWETYTPGVTCNAGTITTLGTTTGQYKRIGKTVFFEAQVPITTVGTCTGPIFILLPLEPVSTTGSYHARGREDGITGVMLVGIIKSSLATNKVMVTKYDGTTCAASGAQCNIGGTYQLP